jgi:WhiB family redox-sensing transcriptional regulator
MTITSRYASTPWRAERGDVFDSLFQRPAWHALAACRGKGTDAFFPDRGEPLDDARAVCAGCPVRRECLDFALEGSTHLYGVWAGTSERERRRLRRVSV